MSDDDLAVVFDWIVDWKLALCRLLATNYFPPQFVTSVEIDAFRIGYVTAGTDNVEIILLADFTDGVIVSDAKGVRFRRLQLVENLAILVRPFGDRILSLRASGTSSSVTLSFLRRQLPCLNRNFELPAATGINERKFQAAIRFPQHLRRHRTRNDFIAGRQNDAVARYSQRTLEHDLIAFTVITLVVFVGFDDCQTVLAAFGNRMSQMHFDVMSGGGEVLSRRISFCLSSGDNLKLQRLASSEIDNRFIRRLAAFADLVEVKARARTGLRHFIIDFELMALGRQ